MDDFHSQLQTCGISCNIPKPLQIPSGKSEKKTSVLDGQSPPPTGPTSRPENPGNWHRVTFHDPVALRQLENIGTYPYVLPLESIRYRSIWPETTVRKHVSKFKDRFLMFWVHVVTCLIPWHSRYMQIPCHKPLITWHWTHCCCLEGALSLPESWSFRNMAIFELQVASCRFQKSNVYSYSFTYSRFHFLCGNKTENIMGLCEKVVNTRKKHMSNNYSIGTGDFHKFSNTPNT